MLFFLSEKHEGSSTGAQAQPRILLVPFVVHAALLHCWAVILNAAAELPTSVVIWGAPVAAEHIQGTPQPVWPIPRHQERGSSKKSLFVPGNAKSQRLC